MKKYIPVEGSDKVNFIKVTTFYDLGGYSYWTNSNKKRGYYVSCTPVFKDPRPDGITMESTILGSGYKQLCKEVTRQTKKSAADAEVIAEQLYGAMVDRICREEGLTIKEEM